MIDNDLIISFKADQMEVGVFKSRKAMGEAAGKAVEEKILELLKEKEELRMIFAAAPSQEELLSYLKHSSLIPWNRITAFHMDEYLGLPTSAPQRFANFLKSHLFDHVELKAVHLMSSNQNVSAACEGYAKLITEKPIDIICLGIGENGHIAFNDPPLADFDDPEIIKVVELEQECRQQQVNDGCFDSLEKVPLRALTLTVPTLMQGNFLYAVVPGKSKRVAVNKTIHLDTTTACPATILKKHPHCKMYLDIDAYGKN